MEAKWIDILFNQGLGVALMGMGLYLLWQEYKKKEKERQLEREAWQLRFDVQEEKHKAEIKEKDLEIKELHIKDRNTALDTLTFVRNMEDAVKKADGRALAEKILELTHKIAEHLKIKLY